MLRRTIIALSLVAPIPHIACPTRLAQDTATEGLGDRGQQRTPQPRLVDVPGYGRVYIMPTPARTADGRIPQLVHVPGLGQVYIVPVPPPDTRSPRQRCLDEEAEREGGAPSPLASAAIDLKCSQR